MELRDTINMMTSEDYKERFKAEYYQAEIRYNKLEAMLDKWDKGELDFEPTCPKALLEVQMYTMGEYLDILKQRAKFEDIEI